MRRITWLGRALGHTRWVPSGNPPLYRLILAMLCIGAVIALIDPSTLPDSLVKNSPDWFDRVFAGVLLFGSGITLSSLYITANSSHHARNLHRSLSWEWFGLALLNTVLLVHIVGLCLQTGLSSSPPVWIEIAVGLWVARTRMPEIAKAMRELSSHDD